MKSAGSFGHPAASQSLPTQTYGGQRGRLDAWGITPCFSDQTNPLPLYQDFLLDCLFLSLPLPKLSIEPLQRCLVPVALLPDSKLFRFQRHERCFDTLLFLPDCP